MLQLPHPPHPPDIDAHEIVWRQVPDPMHAHHLRGGNPPPKKTHPNKTVCTNILRKLFLPIF